MNRHEIHNDSNIGTVTCIDQIHQLLCTSIATCCAEIPAALIAPGTVKRILIQRHQFNMCKIVFFHIRNQFLRNILIIHPLLIFILFPGAQMHFINIHRFIKIFRTLRKPFLIAPFLIIQICNDAGRIGTQLGIKCIRVHLIDNTSGSLCHPILIHIAFFGFCHKQ